MKSAEIVLKELIVAIDSVLYEKETAQDVSLGAIGNISARPTEYRDYILGQRNLAISALDELGIAHQFHRIETPDIIPGA